jgi:hypothetical protein
MACRSARNARLIAEALFTRTARVHTLTLAQDAETGKLRTTGS